MSIQNVQLNIPREHCLFLHPHGHILCAPLLGNVSVSVLGCVRDSPRVSLHLVRRAQWGDSGPTPIKSNHNKFLKGIRCWRSPGVPPGYRSNKMPGNPTAYFNTQSLIRYDLWHTPRHNGDDDAEGSPVSGKVLQFPFSISLPTEELAMTQSTRGSIGYEVVVVADYGNGETRQARQPLEISCRTVHTQNQTFRHSRSFPGQKLKLELSLAPKLPTDTTIQATYLATLVLRHTLSKGLRDKEVKYLVVKEILWQVEEVIKVIDIPTEGANEVSNYRTEKKPHVRQLCHGTKRGCWSLRQAPNRDDDIQVFFEVPIPRDYQDQESRGYPSGFDPLDYSSQITQDRTSIAVEHRLKIDIVVGEDTVHEGCGALVDRKPLFRSFNAVFPLIVWEGIPSDDVPKQAFHAHEVVPRYEEIDSRPPAYIAIV